MQSKKIKKVIYELNDFPEEKIPDLLDYIHFLKYEDESDNFGGHCEDHDPDLV